MLRGASGPKSAENWVLERELSAEPEALLQATNPKPQRLPVNYERENVLLHSGCDGIGGDATDCEYNIDGVARGDASWDLHVDLV